MASDSINPLRRSKASEMKRMSAFSKMAQGEFKQRAKRKKEVVPRDRPEDRFRNEEVFPFLKKDKRIIDYKRLENGVNGKHGKSVPDFLFWTWRNEYWLELKAPGNDLDPGQVVFKEHCIRTNKPHITAWTIADIVAGIENVEEITK